MDVLARWSRGRGEQFAVAEHLPHLFERFYRCDPSRALPGDTGGLGLAIVRSIMQLHGGSVRVESGEQGTRFILVFPLAERSHRKR
ncbi:two-component system, OmpR family, heavy metal sensor histidine kinase CusS [Pseudomonas linyingensis]|uniref:histidine kinase n=1 Tax=Pseudomonas linyingensis TaxID=915471 RepID=A0A1H7CET5_9PSED|nr:two-component system, OmpR family, heavy metal sensor histidine kinase CusS [Pseudomonas linyingensis]